MTNIVTMIIVGLVTSFTAFLASISIIGYIHFKRIAQPNFGAALLRGLISVILIIACFITWDLYELGIPFYFIIYVPVIGIVATFNSVLFFKKH